MTALLRGVIADAATRPPIYLRTQEGEEEEPPKKGGKGGKGGKPKKADKDEVCSSSRHNQREGGEGGRKEKAAVGRANQQEAVAKEAEKAAPPWSNRHGTGREAAGWGICGLQSKSEEGGIG